MFAGDTVVAGTSAAAIRFADGTMLTLAPDSQVTVRGKKDDLSVKIVNGFITFTLGPSSALRVYSGDSVVHAQPGVATTAWSNGIQRRPPDRPTTPAPPDRPPPLSRQ
jgi:ferric-dicitrate binding protein FerR (iron transport regulator)